MGNSGYYCRTLNHAGAAIERSMSVLDSWQPGMPSADLYARMLLEGREAGFAASSLKHIVSEVFKTRFLSPTALPWTRVLKAMRSEFSSEVIEQICFFLTARAEAVLSDFLTMEYWPRLARQEQFVTIETLRAFLAQAVEEGRGGGKWTESRFRRVTKCLSSVCHGFHLFKRNGEQWLFTPPVLLNEVALLLVYDLKEQGYDGKLILDHPDWRLFGLSQDEVRRLLLDPVFTPYFEIHESLTKTVFVWCVETMIEAVRHYVAR